MTSSLRIATWNLNRPGPSGTERNAAISAKMTAINADIWLLTETNLCISPGHTYNSWASPADQPFPLLVYGTIITWFGDKGSREVSGYEEEQRASIPLYAQDWACLRQEGPLCVAGDFNARLRAPTDGLRAETRQTRELLNAALAQNELICTTRDVSYCIDHLCLSADWAERAGPPQQWQATYGADERPVSDHQGVYVDVDCG